jgi:multidrug efflux pump subunit AcrB
VSLQPALQPLNPIVQMNFMSKLLAKGLTPLDAVNAVNTQNLTLPSGTLKIDDKQYVQQF